MKDIIEKIIAFIPEYLTDFGLLLSGPKYFMKERNTRADEFFNKALIFLGISVSIFFLSMAPLQPDEIEFWEFVGPLVPVILIDQALVSGAIYLAWRLVGGKASFKSYITTYAYYGGLLVVLFGLFMLLGDGIMKSLEPEIYKQLEHPIANNELVPDLLSNTTYLTAIGLNALGLLVVSIWGFIGWGAFRELNQLSKIKSSVALIVSSILLIPIFSVIFFMQQAISP